MIYLGKNPIGISNNVAVAPEGYEELVQTVSNVSSAINVLDYTWTDNKSITSTGAEIDSSGSSFATAQVTPGMVIKGFTKGGGSTNRAIAFYKKDMTFVSADYGSDVSNYNWDYQLTVPQDAFYVKLSCITENKGQFTITLCGLTNQVNQNAFDIDELQNDMVNITPTAELISGSNYRIIIKS